MGSVLPLALCPLGLILLVLAGLGRITPKDRNAGWSPLQRAFVAALGVVALGVGIMAYSALRASPLEMTAEETKEWMRPQPVSRPATVPRSGLELRLVVDQEGPGTTSLQGPEGTPLILSPEVVLTQSDLTRVEVGPGLFPPYYVVYLHFTPEAAQRLKDLSRANVNRRLAIVIAGRIFMAPKIMSAVSTPVLIEASNTEEEARQIAERLAP